MRRVITVSLNGNAFQFEDDAYAALGKYLEAAERALGGNPDRAEIVADLEQAIADKCNRHLSAHKSVIACSELEQILREMGPVDGEAGAADEPAAGRTGTGGAAGPAAGAAHAAPRRLYQISEGAKISGVCMGLAAYFGIDVTIVRLLWVAAAFLTGGGVFIAYLVLMFVVPYAQTSEEHAAAHGLPFNARALVERAKSQAAEFASSSEWRRSRAAWRREWRASRAAWRDSWRSAWRSEPKSPPPAPMPPPATPPPPRPPYAAHVLTGLVLAVLGLFLAVFTIGWVIVLVSLFTTGAILGWVLPPHIPFWVAVIALIVIYNLVAWPIKAARHAAYRPGGGYHTPWVAAWDGVVVVAICAVAAVAAYHNFPEFHEFVDHLLRVGQRAIQV